MKKFIVFVQNRKKLNRQRGMTYVELIVVLSIFAVFAGTAVFNYKDFQAKVDIRNLSNQIALKVVQSQKDALAGRLPPSGQAPGVDPWKPSYGMYFEITSGASSTVFHSFVDLNQDKQMNPPINICPGSECLEEINITKGNYISEIKRYNAGSGIGNAISGDLSITFTRPDSGATFNLNGIILEGEGIEFFEIIIMSPAGASTSINVYPSGRVEII
jgi:prepilin-type N-terminal cleavage/methylation domain-containing protein